MMHRIASNGLFSCCFSNTTEEKETTDKVIIPQYEKVPLEKIFQFTQPPMMMPLHPQMKKQPSVITNQPTQFVVPGITNKILRRMRTYEESCFRSRSLLDKKYAPSKLPQIDFILFYDIQTYTLTVSILHCSFLTSTKRKGATNAFVTAVLMPHMEQKFRSQTVYNDVNPIFNERFVFDNISFTDVQTKTLVLRVFNEASNTLIGIAILPLDKTELHGIGVLVILNKTDDIDMSNSNGDIHLSLRYNSSANAISGLIIKAINLNKMDVFGLSDPYVVVKLVYKAEIVGRWQSNVIKNTLSPIFNQSFTFDLADMNLDDVSLQLTVKDKDIIFKDDLMGVVEFGYNVQHVTGCNHWKEAINNPFTRITLWHSLNPANTDS